MKDICFGVGLFGTENAREGVRLAQQAERLGYRRFWVGDSHMIWRELYALLGAIAATTTKLEIGPGVTHPLVRHITVTASALATLNELAPGRCLLGIGVGATGPENIGMKPVGIEAFGETLGLLKKLLAGESIQERRLAGIGPANQRHVAGLHSSTSAGTGFMRRIRTLWIRRRSASRI